MNDPNTTPNFDEILIIRHFNKESTPDEDIALLSWIDVSEENLNTYLKMRQLWALRKINHYASDFEIRRAFDKTEEKIRTHEKQQRRKRIHTIGRYAAIVIFLLGGFLFYHVWNSHDPSVNWHTIAIGDESVRMITLPDSTKVWLNSHSSLSYPEKFTQRFVKISGEVFFEVKPDSERLFVVETSALQIRVTGTSFNIKDRPEMNNLQITLTEGAIDLYIDEQLLASMFPGQQSVFNYYDQQIALLPVNTDLYTSWRMGLVMFEKAYMPDILKGLEETYQIRIVYNVDQSLSNRQYNFVFRKNQPIETVLEMLKFVAPVTYKINENEIFVNENRSYN